MLDWQVSLFVQAQAEMVRVEAMKADNKQRMDAGGEARYHELDFYNVADELDRIARELSP